MKSLVIFDSEYGNTQSIADAIAATLNTDSVAVQNVHTEDIKNARLLVFGSPTQGGRPTKQIQTFIESLRPDLLKNKFVATFDTRFAFHAHGRGIDLVMHIVKFASPKMAHLLTRRGAKLVANPEGFIVNDEDGPLKKGELERARRWAHHLGDVSELLTRVVGQKFPVKSA